MNPSNNPAAKGTVVSEFTRNHETAQERAIRILIDAWGYDRGINDVSEQWLDSHRENSDSRFVTAMRLAGFPAEVTLRTHEQFFHPELATADYAAKRRPILMELLYEHGMWKKPVSHPAPRTRLDEIQDTLRETRRLYARDAGTNHTANAVDNLCGIVEELLAEIERLKDEKSRDDYTH